MTRKRTRSPDDDLYRQCKTHVGEKEFYRCHGKEDNMKAIYAKTLDKLFKGAKQKAKTDVTSEQAKQTTDFPHYKQMFLNNECQLQANGDVKKVSSQDGCCFCANASCSNLNCSFCEKTVSECYILTCKKCNQQFCSLCIFSVYEENDEFSLCRSCY